MVEPIINDPTREAGYALQRNGMLAVGKQSAEGIGHLIESSLTSEGANVAGSVGGGLFKGVGGLVTVALAGAVSAGLTQMDYLHRRDNLANLYKDEIAAKLGKKAGQVDATDLDVIAEKNNTIKEELDRTTKQRNYGLGLSFTASMAALAVIKLALPAVAAIPAVAAAVPFLGVALAAPAALSVAFVGALVIKAAVGVLTYNAVKAPLHAIADKIFHIDEPTANDRIVAVERAHKAGKTITREQVLSVFVAAHPELGHHIAAEYGQAFDSMKPEMQEQVASKINSFLPLDKMTLDINTNNMHVTELAFAVHGQSSGIDGLNTEKEHKHGIIAEMYKGMVDVVPTSVSAPLQAHMQHLIAEPAHIMAMMTKKTHSHHSHETTTETTTKKSFAASHTKKDPNISHVQQLEQASNEPTNGMGLIS